MKSIQILVPVLVMGIAGGCAQVKDRSGLLRNVKTHTVRMELAHTQVANLSIKMLDGFEVEWTKEARYDKYFIYAPSDTGDVQQGMATVDITPDPAKIIPDTAKYQRSIGRLGDGKIQWRERTVIGDDGSKLYQREMSTGDIFKGVEKYAQNGGLVLHVFVVGSDSLLVERLTAVMETIALLPPKSNL